MKKTLIIACFFATIMLLVPLTTTALPNEKYLKYQDESLSSSNLNGPILIIEFTGSGWIIKNIGDEDAFDVEFTLDIDGLVFIGAHTEVAFDSIPHGGEVTISLGFLLGFGSVTITLTVTAENADTVTMTVKGFLLLFYLIIW